MSEYNNNCSIFIDPLKINKITIIEMRYILNNSKLILKVSSLVYYRQINLL